jgi:hypothetical protein
MHGQPWAIATHDSAQPRTLGPPYACSPICSNLLTWPEGHRGLLDPMARQDGTERHWP